MERQAKIARAARLLLYTLRPQGPKVALTALAVALGCLSREVPGGLDVAIRTARAVHAR